MPPLAARSLRPRWQDDNCRRLENFGNSLLRCRIGKACMTGKSRPSVGHSAPTPHAAPIQPSVQMRPQLDCARSPTGQFHTVPRTKPTIAPTGRNGRAVSRHIPKITLASQRSGRHQTSNQSPVGRDPLRRRQIQLRQRLPGRILLTILPRPRISGSGSWRIRSTVAEYPASSWYLLIAISTSRSAMYRSCPGVR